MTKGIHDMLNLPSMDELEGDAPADELDIDFDNIPVPVDEENNDLRMARVADPVDGDGHAESMDTIHKEMLDHARRLMDYGFNVDPRSSATIFEKAAMMYKGAMDAKDSKRDMQLKAIKAMLDQRKSDNEDKKLRAELGEKVQDAEGSIIEDRNELIRLTIQNANTQSS